MKLEGPNREERAARAFEHMRNVVAGTEPLTAEEEAEASRRLTTPGYPKRIITPTSTATPSETETDSAKEWAHIPDAAEHADLEKHRTERPDLF